MNQKRFTTLILNLVWLSAFSAHAEKMDIATHTVVIEKLQGVLKTLPPQNPGRADLVLRLADLFAERSRLEAMDEIAKNCEKCTESRKDREQALSFYSEGVSHTDKETKARVILQMAQIYELQGQPDQAMEVYQNVIKHKGDYNAELVGTSYSGLGELYFRKIKYPEAQDSFEKALAIPETPKKAHASYRLAWCFFHRDNLIKATTVLIEVLKSDEIASDSSFKEEASRDLATFLSRSQVEASQAQLLSNLSPENVRKENLVYLAQELDRLGKKSQSVLVWNIVGQGEKSPRDQMESHIRMAELQFDAGKKSETLVELNATLELWKTHGCDAKDECSVLRNRIRKLVIDWSRAEQDIPTILLENAYSAYVGIFPDMEMNYRAAVAARKLNHFEKAISLYRNASELAANSLKQGISNKQDLNIFTKDFEASLLGEIEVAEITKDAKIRSDAYAHYLSLNPKGEKAFEVRYQQAHLLYESGHSSEAADSFKVLALTENGSSDLRGKSADLSLDALILAKRQELITPWAGEYSKAFPNRKAEFLKIAGKGTLNEVVQTINDPIFSEAKLRKALEKLNQLNTSTATNSEKIATFRNKLIIAEKLKELPAIKSAAAKLLSVKNISREDREFALSRQAWVAELMLDFSTAFNITKKLRMDGVSEQDKLLKLAFLAELSGNDATKYYEKYLTVAKGTPQSVLIAAKLIRHAHNQRAALAKYENFLRSQPDLLAAVALEIFARDHDYDFARKMLSDKSFKNTPAAKVFSRFLFIRGFKSLEKMVAEQSLDTRNDRALKKSLKRRLDLMAKMEQTTQRALKSQDWVLQILTLDSLAKQNKRLAAEVISLTSPHGLNHIQQLQYKNLLAGQARQFQRKGGEESAKVTDLWNKDTMAVVLLEDYQRSKGEIRKLLAEELKLIAKVAPHGQRPVLVQALATGEARPAAVNLEKAKESVKENPFNISSVEKLKELEARAGGETMVAYLDVRISKMQNNTMFESFNQGKKR